MATKVTLTSLIEKFLDKGFSIYEFHMLFPVSLIWICNPTSTLTYEQQKEFHDNWNRPFLEDLDVWIDHQQHKF